MCGCITEIESITATKYKIFIDNEFAFVLYKGDLSRYGIRIGSEISEEQYDRIIEIIYKRAREHFAGLITNCDKTESQIRVNLKRNNYPDSVIDQIIELGIRERFIDDGRYAENYVYCYKARKSLRAIRNDLMIRGVSSDLIDRAVINATEIDESDPDMAALNKLLEKKWPGREELDYNSKNKLIGFLMRKGFSYESVRKAMEEYQNRI